MSLLLFYNIMKQTKALNVVPKIRKLAETARQLQERKTSFAITRLTSIKSLSQDDRTAAKFAQS